MLFLHSITKDCINRRNTTVLFRLPLSKFFPAAIFKHKTNNLNIFSLTIFKMLALICLDIMLGNDFIAADFLSFCVFLSAVFNQTASAQSSS